MSLQDQLLKAGLADAKKAKQIAKEKRAASKQPGAGKKAAPTAEQTHQEAQQEQANRDREINRLKQEAITRKAVAAQIQQLIESNCLERATFINGDIAYRFTDGKKIQKIQVTDPIQRQLARGQLAIVKLAERYELVPTAVAERILSRDPATRAVVALPKTTQQQAAAPAADAADPYANFPIPDDLNW